MGGILGIVFILGRFEGHHVVNSMVVITLTVAYITCSNAQKSCRGVWVRDSSLGNPIRD